ncbi:MAG: hypothetical protein GY716_16335 [bacterium]|nr:hypothetical protein [bacterium]
MQVVAHVDPVLLERELLDRVEQAHTPAGGGLARTLVVTPTRRLASHVQRRLAGRREAWLGLEVLDLAALTRRILEHGRVRPMGRLSKRLGEALVRRVAYAEEQNAWSEFVRRRPGTIRGLAASLQDLREAGLTPGDVSAACREESEHALGRLYAAYCRELDTVSRRGFADEAGLIARAIPHAARLAGKFGAIFLYGAYELNGIQLQLLGEMHSGRSITVLLPHLPDRPVSTFADELALRCSGEGRQAIEVVEHEASADRLAVESMYDEAAHPRPAADRIGFRHAQGTAAEVRAAVREALRAAADGVDPKEIALVARSLDPFASALEACLEAEGIPWTSSLRGPLRRLPLVHDFLLLLRVTRDGYPRRAVAELLASPRVRWSALGEKLPESVGDHAERFSLEAQLVGGLDDWTTALVSWAGTLRHRDGAGPEEIDEARRRAERRVERARGIGACLTALDAQLDPRAGRSWGEHADNLARLTDGLFGDAGDGEDDPARAALRELLADMARLESVVGDRRKIEFAAMVVWLEDAVDRSELVQQEFDGGGIRVLDAMQLRGLTFHTVQLLGMNSGRFPRIVREDPILGDALRQRLRDATGRPLPLKGHGHREERLLLALMLGAAAERIDVSWQRADESGKSQTPSLDLRELARLRYGTPDLERLRADARHLPSHPEHALSEMNDHCGLLSVEDERLWIALLSSGARSRLLEDSRFARLEPGLRMLRATQSFTPVDPRYDARLATRIDRPLSITDIERLGRCPLQYFFRRVLGVYELDDEANAFVAGVRDVGIHVHAVLETVYATLLDEGLFGAAETEPPTARALELLAEHRSRLLGPSAERLAERLPVLWGRLAAEWNDSVREFVEADLRRAFEEGWRPRGFEQDLERRLDFGDGVEATLRARFDRVLERDDQTRIGDYKTSGQLKPKISAAQMLKGRRVQVPLYWMLAGERASVEVLGVGPNYEAEIDDRVEFDGFKKPEELSGFRESMRVLVSLRDGGSFPSNPDSHCSWCPYEAACRHTHAPTEEREELFEDSAAFRLLETKSGKQPLLPTVEKDAE